MGALIDGDIILYGCGFASQHTWYYVFCEEDLDDPEAFIARYKYKADAVAWVDGQMDLVVVPKIVVDPVALAFSNVRNYIKKVLRQTRAHDYTIYFSDSPLERDDIATLQVYKGNRIGAPKPVHYQAIKDYVMANYVWKVYPTLEADDGMAMDQKDDGSTIICTLDKDLDMVPGMRYRDGKIYEIDEREGLLAFYTQLITGDSTDNIPGLFKITGRKATAPIKELLKDCTTDREMYEYVRQVYADAWPYDCGELTGWDVVLLEVGKLLWMRRDIDKNWEIPREPLDDADQKGLWGLEDQ